MESPTVEVPSAEPAPVPVETAPVVDPTTDINDPSSLSVDTDPTVEPTPSESATPEAEAPNCKKLKCIALTIDDGPVDGTAEVLDLFKEKGIHVTFFVLGKNAKAHQDIIKRMAEEGHVVGNHSWKHPQFWKMSASAIRKEITSTDKQILKATGWESVTLLRPPYGQMSATVRKVAKEEGKALVLWDVDPEDWKYRNTKTVINNVVSATRRNSVILTHDIWPTTRAAYSKIIDKLQAKGYTFVTIPELFGKKLKPGKSVR
ncbi:MAG: polysaccharide deacetylase family protein [Propionibacteriaceae bacterium]|nr:polysaccharide deacetylase family protein [Propionibacteriaceae bacterium]